MDRDPYAYWKGNPVVAETRMDLLKCNVSDKQDWNARVYAQVRTVNLQNFFFLIKQMHRCLKTMITLYFSKENQDLLVSCRYVLFEML